MQGRKVQIPDTGLFASDQPTADVSLHDLPRLTPLARIVEYHVSRAEEEGFDPAHAVGPEQVDVPLLKLLNGLPTES